MRLFPKLLDKWTQKAAVQPVGAAEADRVAFGMLPSGGVQEPFPGAWQRNLDGACHPSITAFSAVFACVSIISGDIAKLPINIRRKLPRGGYEEAVNHPYNDLLWKPNDYQTRMDFMQQFMVSTLLRGNAYIWLERDRREVVSAMYVLHPDKVRTLVGDNGDVFYRVGKNKLTPQMTMGEEGIVVPASEIIHHRGMCLEHPLVGVSPLYAAASSAAVGARIIMQSDRLFGNMSRPSGILVAPGRVNKETMAAMKEQWEANYGGGNLGRTAVLGDGLKWEPVSMSANDAQLIEQLKWAKEDVATAFRVPMFMLGGSDKVSYNNSEQLMRGYYSGCLQYHLEALEMRFDIAFKLPRDTLIKFDLAPLMRTEMTTRFNAYAKAIASGFKTINECRAMEDDAPVDGGDEPLFQKQYVPLSKLGEEPPAPPAPAASEDGEGDSEEGDEEGDDDDDEDKPDPPASNEESYDFDRLSAVFDGALARSTIGAAA